MNFMLAFRAFFATLFDRVAADRVRLALSPVDSNLVLEQGQKDTPLPNIVSEEKPSTRFPQQNGAITFLAALQREARFVDFIQEPLTGFSDAQIGAVARTVHDDCAKVLRRFFDLQPIINQPEESSVEITTENAALFQLTGNLNQALPCQGKLIHSGWKATKTELPIWSGQSETALIVAPSEVEIGGE